MACRFRGIASIETGLFAGYSSGIPNRGRFLSCVLVTRPSFIASSYPRRPRRGSALQCLPPCLLIGSHDGRIY